jgi:hypothetical protein
VVRIAVRLAALNGATWECVIDQWILSLSNYIFLLDQSDCPLHKPAIKGYLCVAIPNGRWKNGFLLRMTRFPRIVAALS